MKYDMAVRVNAKFNSSYPGFLDLAWLGNPFWRILKRAFTTYRFPLQFPEVAVCFVYGLVQACSTLSMPSKDESPIICLLMFRPCYNAL